MDMNRYIGNKFLGAIDYPRPAVLTILNVSEEIIGEDQKEKVVVWFERMERGLVLNKTNLTVLIELFGAESDDWTGQKIEIFVDPNVMFAGKRIPALRLRAPQQRMDPPVAPQRPAPQRPAPQQMAPANAVSDDLDIIPDPGEPMTARQRQQAGQRAPF